MIDREIEAADYILISAEMRGITPIIIKNNIGRSLSEVANATTYLIEDGVLWRSKRVWQRTN